MYSFMSVTLPKPICGPVRSLFYAELWFAKVVLTFEGGDACRVGDVPLKHGVFRTKSDWNHTPHPKK